MAFLDCVDVHAIAEISQFDVAEAVGTGAKIDENVVGFYVCPPRQGQVSNPVESRVVAFILPA